MAGESAGGADNHGAKLNKAKFRVVYGAHIKIYSAKKQKNKLFKSKGAIHMKKFIAILTVTALIFTLMAIPVHAAEPEITKLIDATPENVFVQDADGKNVTIPVYGYVGEDAVITDNDPTNPDVPPEVTTADINVSVPVKIIWAAFESDGGAITAPDYYIKNNSSTEGHNLAVTLTKFITENGHATTIDENLILNIKIKKDANEADVVIPDVIGIGGELDPKSSETFAETLANQEVLEFTLTGHYDFDVDNIIAYEPKYQMVLTFAVDKTN